MQGQTASLLPNGTVLLAGGVAGTTTLSAAQVYDANPRQLMHHDQPVLEWLLRGGRLLQHRFRRCPLLSCRHCCQRSRLARPADHVVPIAVKVGLHLAFVELRRQPGDCSAREQLPVAVLTHTTRSARCRCWEAVARLIAASVAPGGGSDHGSDCQSGPGPSTLCAPQLARAVRGGVVPRDSRLRPQSQRKAKS